MLLYFQVSCHPDKRREEADYRGKLHNAARICSGSSYFPLPEAIPAINCFWKITYTTITGTIASEVAAKRPP